MLALSVGKGSIEIVERRLRPFQRKGRKKRKRQKFYKIKNNKYRNSFERRSLLKRKIDSNTDNNAKK